MKVGNFGKCHICGRGIFDGISVYRQNEKGQPAIWACLEHSKPLDPDLVRSIAQAENDLLKPTKH